MSFESFWRESAPNEPPASTWRTVAWDPLEERLALSAQPVAALVAPPQLHLETPSLLSWQPHEATGVDYAREEFGFTGAGQTVAVIDSGIWYQHEDLGGGYGSNYRVVGGWDFTGAGDANPRDDGPAGFHGTHVAGIIGSSDAQYTGVAPEVDLVALRVFDNQGNGNWGWVESALSWVHTNRNSFENPITTVNLSLGADLNTAGPPNWAMLEDELAQLEADGIFISVSAGNAFQDYLTPGLSYPGSSTFVTPVMSVDEQGQLSDFSQRHSRAIAAPGEDIVSTIPDYLFGADGVHNDYASASGTSMAAPYVAGASVLLREALWFTGDTNVTSDEIYDLMAATADQVYDSVTGAFYNRLNVRAAIDRIMSTGEQDTDASDWGAVAQSSQTDVTLGQSQAYLVQATQDGLLTIEAFFAHSGGDVNLTVYDMQGNVLAGSNGQGDIERIDIAATAGQSYRLETSGANAAVDFRLTNLVALDGDRATVFGTNGDDAFTFSAGAALRVSVNGVRYSLDRQDVSSVTFAGGAGNDAIDVSGGAGVDRATLRAGRFTMTGDEGTTATFEVSGASLETIRLTGGLGADFATFYDSVGDDRLVMRPGSTTQQGAGYFNSARGFERVAAYSTVGGRDTAYFYDSSGDDSLRASPRQVELNGDAFRVTASGYARSFAHASQGGFDRAMLFGSSGSDRFTGNPQVSVLVGAGYANSTNGFERVEAQGMGGNDSATLSDSTGNDRLTALPNFVELEGATFSIVVRDFRETAAFATAGGADRAILYGDGGDDLFEGGRFWGRMTSEEAINSASGFARTYSRAGAGGVDRAVFYDIGRGDLMYGRDDLAMHYSPGFRGYAYGFDDVAAHAKSGESANSDVTAVDYLFDRVGAWS